MVLSVIITALNEQDNIEDTVKNVLRSFSDFGITGEIIVVNDGSTDRTQDIVSNLGHNDARIKMIKHNIPEGVGASFWDGVDAAGGDVVVWFPGDNENDPREILRYYRLLKELDMVIPFVFNKEVRPFLRKILSRLYLFIINNTFGVSFNYTNGTNLYRKSILKSLNYRSKGFFFQTDILIKLARKGYLFAEVPYSLGIRQKGKTKAFSFFSFLQVLKDYLHLIKECYLIKDKRTNMYFSEDSITKIRRNL